MPGGQAEYARIKAEHQGKLTEQSAVLLLLTRATAVNRAETERTTGALVDLVAALERRVGDLEERVAQLESAHG